MLRDVSHVICSFSFKIYLPEQKLSMYVCVVSSVLCKRTFSRIVIFSCLQILIHVQQQTLHMGGEGYACAG